MADLASSSLAASARGRHGRPAFSLESERGLIARLRRAVAWPAALSVTAVAGAEAVAAFARFRVASEGARIMVVLVLVIAAAVIWRRLTTVGREWFEQSETTRRWWESSVQRVGSVLAEQQKLIDSAVDHVLAGHQPSPVAAPPGVGGPLVVLDQGVATLRAAVVEAIVRVAAAHPGQIAGFTRMSRRLQGLADRALSQIDAVENSTDDPDLLDRVYPLMNLLVRMRHQVESLAILSGAEPRRFDTAESLSDVVRKASSEIADYLRVSVQDLPVIAIEGRAAPSLRHALVALLENGCEFSPAPLPVHIGASMGPWGLEIHIDDQGLGLSATDERELNEQLSSPPGAQDRLVAERLQQGRLGLVVVAHLAARYGLTVQLRRGVPQGTRAVVVVPFSLLTDLPDVTPRHQPPPPGQPQPTVRVARPGAVAPQPAPARAAVAGGGPVRRDSGGLPELPVRTRGHLHPSLLPSPGTAQPDRPTPDPAAAARFLTSSRHAASHPAPMTASRDEDTL